MNLGKLLSWLMAFRIEQMPPEWATAAEDIEPSVRLKNSSIWVLLFNGFERAEEVTGNSNDFWEIIVFFFVPPRGHMAHRCI